MGVLCLRNPGCPVQFAAMFAAVVFALTLLMIVLHPGEWLLLAQLARARPEGAGPVRSRRVRPCGASSA